MNAEVRLAPMTPELAEASRRWRIDARVSLRTPGMLTVEQQATWYRDVVCDRRSPHRYWAIEVPVEAVPGRWVSVGVGGLTDIAFENGNAEISLILLPERTGHGLGAAAVDAILAEAFGAMRLQTVFGECYECNPALGFWRRMVERFGGSSVVLPRRKFWAGQLYDADWFTFTVEAWRERHGDAC